MKEKSKPLLGQRIGNRIYFNEQEKKQIINVYLSGKETKQAVYKRYTGYETEHGKINKWMRELGMEKKFVKSTNFTDMAKRNPLPGSDSEAFETRRLQKRIEELERQLKEAEMKAIAYSTMVDIAEKQFKIPIRKKYNTKP